MTIHKPDQIGVGNDVLVRVRGPDRLYLCQEGGPVSIHSTLVHWFRPGLVLGKTLNSESLLVGQPLPIFKSPG